MCPIASRVDSGESRSFGDIDKYDVVAEVVPTGFEQHSGINEDPITTVLFAVLLDQVCQSPAYIRMYDRFEVISGRLRFGIGSEDDFSQCGSPDWLAWLIRVYCVLRVVRVGGLGEPIEDEFGECRVVEGLVSESVCVEDFDASVLCDPAGECTFARSDPADESDDWSVRGTWGARGANIL